jgi:hypothetical protein
MFNIQVLDVDGDQRYRDVDVINDIEAGVCFEFDDSQPWSDSRLEVAIATAKAVKDANDVMVRVVDAETGTAVWPPAQL